MLFRSVEQAAKSLERASHGGCVILGLSVCRMTEGVLEEFLKGLGDASIAHIAILSDDVRSKEELADVDTAVLKQLEIPREASQSVQRAKRDGWNPSLLCFAIEENSSSSGP